MLATATARAGSPAESSTTARITAARRNPAQYENAARTEERIGEERDDRGVQAVDPRHAEATAAAIPTGTSIVVSTRPAIRSRGSQPAWYWLRTCNPGSQRFQPFMPQPAMLPSGCVDGSAGIA